MLRKTEFKDGKYIKSLPFKTNENTWWIARFSPIDGYFSRVLIDGYPQLLTISILIEHTRKFSAIPSMFRLGKPQEFHLLSS